MSGLFGGGGKPVQNAAPVIANLRVQTSALGRAIALVWGTTRVAVNLIWYGAFAAVAHTSTQSSGGKGGEGGGTTTTTTYTYTAALLLAICAGAVSAVLSLFVGKARRTLAESGLTLFPGDTTQVPFGFIATSFPAQALGYRGIAYLAHSAYDLGDQGALTNHNAEVTRSAYGSTGQSAKTFTVGALAVETHAETANMVFGNGQEFTATGGSLPAPLVNGNNYFVRDVNGLNFNFAATLDGAAITLTTSGSGTLVYEYYDQSPTRD